jgi:hypothetical protein
VKTLSGRQRILCAILHEEGDRVPISPRVHIWLMSEYGDSGLGTLLEHMPDIDPMYILPSSPPNVVDSYPDTYHIPEVKVDQKKYRDGPFLVVERTFLTPAGRVSDTTRIPEAGREFGVDPTPVKMKYLVEDADDLDALRYVLVETGADYRHLRRSSEIMGDRGVVMVLIRSALDHNAGFARSIQDLMTDYYLNRGLFDELLGIFHRRSLARIKNALEQGARFIFGSWYFNSLSAGWSPRIFEEVFLPQIRDHVELTHSYGAYYDYYDDGKLAQTMAWIAATGVDVLETCTPPPMGDFDLAEAKRRIGQLTTLKGYVDLLHVVKEGSPELVEQTVRTAMETAKAGGGFIIGSSDSFRDGTPRANIQGYFRACKKYGRYP